VLAGLCGQRATLKGQPPVQARIFLGLDNRLGHVGDLLPERLALNLRLLGPLEQIGAVGVGRFAGT
jgi:hypothetical protein